MSITSNGFGSCSQMYFASGAPSLILFCYLYYMIWVLNKVNWIGEKSELNWMFLSTQQAYKFKNSFSMWLLHQYVMAKNITNLIGHQVTNVVNNITHPIVAIFNY